MSNQNQQSLLQGKTILVLEDEVLIAMTIEDCLIQAGAENVLIATSLQQVGAFGTLSLDAAVLDVRVKDGTSYELARSLLAQGIGVTFHSGHVQSKDIVDIPNAVFCEKPSLPKDLINSVQTSLKSMG